MSVSLADAIFWIAVVCCAVAQWFILRLALATPRRPEGGAAGARTTTSAGHAVPASPRATEVAWAVVPAVVLALVLAATWRAVHETRAPAAPHAAPEHTAASSRPLVPL